MKQMTVFALLCIVLTLNSCISKPKKSTEPEITNSDTLIEDSQVNAEDKLHEIILNLPEVKAKTNELRKINPDIHLATMIQGYPEAGSPYYLIEFAEMQETHKTNIYWFYVHQETLEVYVGDLVSDEIIPIETYRLEQKK
jgi:hypothetical protein